MSKSNHKTPAEHYWHAEELLNHCEVLRKTLSTEGITEQDYEDTVEAMRVFLLSAQVAAALAAAPDPGPKPTRP